MRPARTLAVGIALLGAGAAPAGADERVVAGPGTHYATPSVSIDQGEALFLSNQDVMAAHDVVALDSGPDGEPLFRSPLLAPGGEAEVAGVKFLTTGDYAFGCSIHPSMRGRLVVTTAGAPLPRPDRRPPMLTASLRAKRLAAIARGVKLHVASDERATLRARARLYASGRVYRGPELVVELAPGERRTLRLRLPMAARRAIRRMRRVTVEAAGRAVDAAGNAAGLRLRRTVRR